MCGISGLWFKSQTEEHELLKYGELMSSGIAKRGPDVEGTWKDFDSSLIFKHRRLSIRDLSTNGDQPMISADKNMVMIFNGEIYNFYDLKKELKTQKWRGNSDTEVLLAAIQEWGIKKALKKCCGMFAIALWNIREKKLTLARDRFGEKPLYWGEIKLKNKNISVFTFTSDLSSLWAIPDLQKEIEYGAFSDFLKYSYIRLPKTIQKGIFQLKPGHLVEIKSKNGFAPLKIPETKSWWNINEESSSFFAIQSDQDDFKLLEKNLKLVLKEQQSADVPTASFLSGGIDSSLIAALLQSQSSSNIKTFNVAFPEGGHGEILFNEGPYAKKIANFLNTDHTEISLTFRDIKNIIPEIPHIYSEPFADASQIPSYLICKEIRNSNIKVAITGDGADELFGGYNRHLFAPLIYNSLKKTPDFLKRSLTNIIRLLPSNNKDLTQEKRRKLIDAILQSKDFSFLYDAILSNNFEIKNFHKHPNKEIHKPFLFESIYANSLSEKVMLADSISYLPNNILTKLDRAAMHVGLETRAPYLDVRIANLAWQLKLKNKIKTENQKYISKYALKKILFNYIPEEYFDRPKTGFSLPIATWLRGPLKDWANDLINKDSLNKQNFLCSKNTQRIWESHLKGNSDNTQLLWTILMWQAWQNR